MVDLKIISKSVIEGEKEKIIELVEQAIKEGVPADGVLSEGLIAGMNVVGEQMRKHEMFIPEVLLSATTMQAGLDFLKPLLGTAGAGLGPKVVLGTVKGDIHEIGKNLVGMMLKGAGFQVVDLGANNAAEEFVRAAKEEEAQIVAMSALLTTTMREMGKTIEALKAAGVRENIKVIVGGAPVSPEYATQIGADGYARDAARAVDKVRELVG